MLDNEILISKIKNHVAIWNTSSPEYHNKTIKDQSWNTLCEELIEKWNTLSTTEKYKRCIELKRKWINIRDYYKKELAKVEAAEAGRAKKKRRKYVHFNILSFLQPIYNRKITESVAEDQIENEQVENDQLDIEQIFNEQISNDQIYNDENDYESDQPSTSTPTLARKKRKTPAKLNLFESSLVDALKQRSSSTEEEDSDLFFLKSLLPDIKKLTDSQKIDFKLGTLQLLKNMYK